MASELGGDIRAFPNLAEGLAAYRPIWGRWLAFSREAPASSDSAMVTAAALAQRLRKFLEEQEKVQWPLSALERAKILARQFGFAERDIADVDPGQGRVQVEFDRADGRVTGLYYSVRKVGNARDKSIMLHELAHVFYGAAAELAGRTGDPFATSGEIERFCWQFASEWALPREELRRFDRAHYLEILRGKGVPALASARLGFWGLVALAGHFSVSLRLLISALDRGPLLDQLEAGVAVMANTPNLITKESADLRIVMVARPQWGHVIYNERAVRLGFAHAYEALERGKSMTSASVNETLKLKRHTPERKLKWTIETLTIGCEYTPVDVRSEGRYLVAIWQWPRLAAGAPQNA